MPDFPTDRPRVFLSHSKHDAPFLDRIHTDFSRCQIYPWLDTQEIRHGQPWLDAIFVGGIPTCDCVLVYLTENSIESPMVKKEIDAAIIKKLQDNHVAFLPYVSDAALRTKLRVDIQTIQTPEWNGANYGQMLPQVVAEIWHSFLDRRLIAATSEERAKRLELELAIERQKDAKGGVFSESEEKDFSYIWKQFDREEVTKFAVIATQDGKRIEKASVEAMVSCQPLVAHINEYMTHEFDYHYIESRLRQAVGDELRALTALPEKHGLSVSSRAALGLELRTFGLLRQETETDYFFDKLRTVHKVYLSEKMWRFRYWLAFKGLISESDPMKPGQAKDIAGKLAAALRGSEPTKLSKEAIERGRDSIGAAIGPRTMVGGANLNRVLFDLLL